MKRLWVLLILVASFLGCIGTLAEGGGSYSIANMPEAIKSIIDSSKWSGWDITGWVNPNDLRSDTACAFAVVKNGNKNDLLAFRWRDGSWKYYWHNASALPQVKEPVVLVELGSGEFASYYVYNEEISDILGQHGGGKHMNFETLAPNPARPDKMMVVDNMHIYLMD